MSNGVIWVYPDGRLVLVETVIAPDCEVTIGLADEDESCYSDAIHVEMVSPWGKM